MITAPAHGAPDLYDTTLRDGAQGKGLSLTVSDKVAVARHLDAFGVGFIEGGWPGAIPRDTEFFRRAAHELVLHNALLAAFGATRRPDCGAARDPQVIALLAAETPVVTVVAKSHSRHVELALRTTPAENLAMIDDTVRHLVRAGRRVFLDAEHFFDGYLADACYAVEVVRVAAEAGAEAVVLCDTNGGALPQQVGAILAATAELSGARLGIHCHDDSGCAVANTLEAVAAGAVHAQVTAHGYGERCGNANLFSVAANLVLKMGRPVVAEAQLARMSAVARAIATITAVPADESAPYVGSSAFSHKAGLHASALRIDPALYQHVEPDGVGNVMRTVISDMAGRASIELKAAELGYALSARSPVVARIADRVKTLEHRGYAYESADASFELLLRDELSVDRPDRPFEAPAWRLTSSLESDGSVRSRAVVDLRVGAERRTATGTGCSEAEALDDALRQGLEPFFPQVARMAMVDHQARTLQPVEHSTTTRVLVTYCDGERRWSTVGVDKNAVAASWSALLEAFRHILLDPVAAPVAPRRLETSDARS